MYSLHLRKKRGDDIKRTMTKDKLLKSNRGIKRDVLATASRTRQEEKKNLMTLETFRSKAYIASKLHTETFLHPSQVEFRTKSIKKNIYTRR